MLCRHVSSDWYVKEREVVKTWGADLVAYGITRILPSDLSACAWHPHSGYVASQSLPQSVAKSYPNALECLQWNQLGAFNPCIVLKVHHQIVPDWTCCTDIASVGIALRRQRLCPVLNGSSTHLVQFAIMCRGEV